ncbi:ABC transporter ATP-binding protein [Oculatella sp. FACHB-28]|uniref:ABC transporter ATP-binding protein n=1 Tax=Oculatella sp. FACHB-28 TaxID=2692845 RepID=UPI0016834A8A|nr:ABC transporter ATP-binding protein [Oculatella sp. FACHB-28]MBD2057171.1 ABC transporter ATP-binding protein [Oculatella sp. FACHB-28]
MLPSAILHLENVTKQFSRAAAPAVNDITLTLQEGDVLGLLGPSGCGKTTLLRMIAGFESPQTGRVELAGRLVAGNGTWIAPENRSIGMVFQDFALFPHLNVAENVAFGLKQRDSKKLWQERTIEAIALVGLQGLENRYPHELSGGQQQRVALARALAPRPTLVLLDEPLSNLDVQVRLYLRQEVRDILKKTGTSGIFVTHDQEEALSISDQVAVMRQGHLEQIGTPEAIYREPASRFVADFVTQANFVPARYHNQRWQTEIGHFDADSVACACSCDRPSELENMSGDLMIRQEDLILHPDAEGNVTVGDRQFLGREYSYRLYTSSGRVLQARTPTSMLLSVGQSVQLSVTNSALKFFPVQNSARPSAASIDRIKE